MDGQDRATFELWKGLTPPEAYMSGSDDQGGMLFIPTRDNISAKRREIDDIWKSTTDKSIRSLLRRARCHLDLQEPHKPPMVLKDAMAIHLVKGGIESPLLSTLIRNSILYMENAMANLKIHRWPIETQVMSIYQTDSLLSMLKLLPKDISSISQKLKDLIDSVREYQDALPLRDLKGLSFKDMIFSIGEGDGHLGRRDLFPRVLGEFFSFSDRHEILEEKILMELYKELPRFKRASFEVKEIYNTSMDSEEILDAITKEKVVKSDKITQTVERLRARLAFWGVRRVIDYPHERDTGHIETPEYLRPIIGSGEYMNMDGLTGKPVNDLYLSLDGVSERSMSFPDLFVLLVHEELGSRAHYLNSFLRPHRDVRMVDLLLGPIMTSTMDGFTDNRQHDVIDLMQDMINRRKDHLPGERRLLDHVQEMYPANELIAEVEFLISRKRILDLLSGVADIRINTGKQSIMEFLRWANIITGMEKSVLCDAVMGPAFSPGQYAYQQILTIELKGISESKRKHGVSIRDFNTMTTRMGFPSWNSLKEKLMGI